MAVILAIISMPIISIPFLPAVTAPEKAKTPVPNKSTALRNFSMGAVSGRSPIDEETRSLPPRIDSKAFFVRREAGFTPTFFRNALPNPQKAASSSRERKRRLMRLSNMPIAIVLCWVGRFVWRWYRKRWKIKIVWCQVDVNIYCVDICLTHPWIPNSRVYFHD